MDILAPLIILAVLLVLWYVTSGHYYEEFMKPVRVKDD